MVSFFKINAVGRILTLFVLFCLLRGLFFWNNVPLLIPEIQWLALAERMQEGFMPYISIWDDTSPLSALVYWLLGSSFGKNILPLHILAAILVFMQGFILNSTFIRAKIYEERTLIPLFLYLILSNLFLDWLILSPMMMATTFIILSIRHIFLHLNENVSKSQAFEIGFYLGLAVMFYLPLFILLLLPLFVFAVFTGTKARDYILMFFAFLLPFLLILSLFFVVGGEKDFIVNGILSMFFLGNMHYLATSSILLVLIVPTTLIILGFLMILQSKRYTNYQLRCQQIMFLTLLNMTLSLLFGSIFSGMNFYIFLPVIVFFGSFYFLGVQKWFIAETIMILVFVASLVGTTSIILKIFPEKYTYFLRGEIISEDNKIQANLLKNKKILVLGTDLSAYRYASLATPYLNAQLSSRHFDKLDDYFVLTEIYHNFKKDMPQIIVDKQNLLPKILLKMPLLAREYKITTQKGIYQRN